MALGTIRQRNRQGPRRGPIAHFGAGLKNEVIAAAPDAGSVFFFIFFAGVIAALDDREVAGEGFPAWSAAADGPPRLRFAVAEQGASVFSSFVTTPAASVVVLGAPESSRTAATDAAAVVCFFFGVASSPPIAEWSSSFLIGLAAAAAKKDVSLAGGLTGAEASSSWYDILFILRVTMCVANGGGPPKAPASNGGGLRTVPTVFFLITAEEESSAPPASSQRRASAASSKMTGMRSCSHASDGTTSRVSSVNDARDSVESRPGSSQSAAMRSGLSSARRT
mmetsp:Transcript_11248/g.45542  ORF Transcript_11248/g.45542 Transcript_11248/m.45542 type:complete len:280 (+) Transcript_11248:63-902(+)